MEIVQWLTKKNIPCEVELASDEMDRWESGVKCSEMAQVHITYAKLKDQNTCYHHYITRTAQPIPELMLKNLQINAAQ
jgi:hypothetical protein